jgi:PAS domain S-box-containing protein
MREAEETSGAAVSATSPSGARRPAPDLCLREVTDPALGGPPWAALLVDWGVRVSPPEPFPPPPPPGASSSASEAAGRGSHPSSTRSTPYTNPEAFEAAAPPARRDPSAASTSSAEPAPASAAEHRARLATELWRLFQQLEGRLSWEETARLAAGEDKETPPATDEAPPDALAALARLLQAIPAQVVVKDRAMALRYANPAAQAAFTLPDAVPARRRCYAARRGHCGLCRGIAHRCPSAEALREQRLALRWAPDEGRVAVAIPLRDCEGRCRGVLEGQLLPSRRESGPAEEGAGWPRRLLERLPWPVFLKDDAGRYLDLNPAFAQLLGTSVEALRGQRDEELFHPTEVERMRGYEQQVRRSGRVDTTRERRGIGGQQRELEITRLRLPGPEGAPARVAGIVRDLSEQIQTETELHRTRSHLRSVAKHSPIILLTVDLQDRVVTFNPGAEGALGYWSGEVANRPVDRLFRADEEYRALREEAFRCGAVRDRECALLTRSGEALPVRLTVSPLRDEQDTLLGLTLIAQDMSHQKQLMTQVLQAERLAAVGRLAAGVAHEINNPLAVIGEIAGFLQELLHDDPEAREGETREELTVGLPKLTVQVRRARAITMRLLRFARKSAHRTESTDVSSAIDEVLPFVRKPARLAEVELERDLAVSLPRVSMEELELQEVVINLVTNAIQAIEGTGRPGTVRLATRLAGERVVLEISDDGPGIEPGVRDRIFEPFVTTKPPGVGTGLGLSLCYGIVTAAKGELQVDSERHRGTRFTVFLPCEGAGS